MQAILPKLAKVKAAMGGVVKGTKNGFFKSNYADLNSHLAVVEPLLDTNGLVLLQPIITKDDGNYVQTMIIDVDSGESIFSEMKLIGDVDMQKAGSAVTYARRYTLGSLLSMQAVDDDGEGAMGRGNTKTASAPKKSTPAKSSFNKAKAKASATPTPVLVESNGDDL